MGTPTSEPRAKGVPVQRASTVDVDHGTAYELVLGLRMFVDDEEPSSYAVGADWFERVRKALDDATLAAIDRYCAGHELLFGYLLSLAVETPAPRTGADFLDTLGATSPRDLRLLQLGHRLETFRGGIPRQTIERAADGDGVAARELLAGCIDWQRAAYEHVLSRPAEEAKRDLEIACRGWYDAVLHPDEPATALVLKRSARAARALAQRLPPEQLVDTLTRGIRYAPEPGIERILLVPHIASRPWSIFTEAWNTKIVCFGIAESQITGDSPPDPLVAAYKALGDDTRLRILRRLADGPASLQELTQMLGLAKSTVHGHLLVLRTGGLVIADVSRKTGYRLRRETLAESAALLETYLEGTEA